MAFRQPTHAPPRIYTSTAQQQSHSETQEHITQPIEEPQEWVLFSPISSSDRTQTGTSTTTQGARFARTPGRSRIADYSSLGYDDEDGEDGELDSLDSHLPAFRADHSVYRNGENESASQHDLSGSVLPQHDGLGSFRVDSGQGIQEHLYTFEQYNPRRVKRRRESLELGDAIFGGEIDLENQRDQEKTRWIEEWRTEQSRVLLEEIQRETRRRRKQSMSSAGQHVGMKSRRMSILDDDVNVETATLGGYDSTETQEGISNEHEGEGFWHRLTQTVIRDLMGIDDRLLAILFGEALPELLEDDDISTTPPTNTLATNTGTEHIGHLHDSVWEHRLLDRITREFGILVSQLSDHPGAFSTYVRTRARERQMPLPYAGLPMIPELAVFRDTETTQARERTAIHNRRTSSTTQASNDLNTPIFQPTLQSTTAPIDISSSSLHPNMTLDQTHTSNTHKPQNNNNIEDIVAEREYWERELDIKMVFRYLRSRFSRNPTSPATASTIPTNNLTSSIQEGEASVVAARAARVRLYHPLVRARTLPTASTGIASGAVATGNSVFIGTRNGVARSSGKGRSLGGRSLSESCKSQSVRSARGRSGGSRNYWEGAGSSLSGSMGVSTGGMGSWGEV